MSTLPSYNSRNDFFISADVAGLFQRPRGAVGLRRSANWQDSIRTLINTNPEARQVSQIAVTGSPSAGTFSVKVAGKTVSYVSDGSPTQDEVGNGLTAALNADPVSRGAAEWAYSGGNITGTGIAPGMSFSVTDAASGLTISTITSAAVADPVPFGRAVIKLPGVYTPAGNECCALASTANLTAQVVTLTVAYTSGKAYQVDITVDEQTYNIYVVAATDLATLTTALVTDIEAAMPANTVVAASSVAGTITLTAEVAGKPFAVAIGAQTTPGNLTIAYTTFGPATNFFNVFGGVSEIADNVEGVYTTDSDAGALAYKPNAGVKCVYRAADGIYVDNAQTPTDSDRVYVELAPGDNAGKFYTTTSATRLRVPRNLMRWQGDPNMAADGLGILCVAPY